MPEQIRPQGVGHHRVSHRMADGLTALFLLALATAVCFKMATDHPEVDAPWILLVQAAVFATLICRSAYPRTVLLVSTVAYAGVLWHLDGIGLPLILAPAAAMVAVAARGDRRTTILCWGAASAVLVVSESMATGEVFQANQIGFLVWLGFFAAVGEAVQSKKAYVAAVEERALRAEHTRDEEARRRVAEERLRIAQELHDVVAHHIAVIHVQASVAEHLVTEKPAEAAEALTHVRRSSRTVLDELTGLLNVLRQPGDSKTPIEPAAGVEDLPQLIHSFESSGLRVSWAVRGDRRPLPPALDLVAYRLVQEGLTNAHKHGSGSATLDVRFTGEAILIDLTNDSGARAEPGEMGPDSVLGGYGLIGMRERALAVGGSLRAAPEPDGTWRVRARLPIRAEKVPAAKKPVTPPAPAVVVKVASPPAGVVANTAACAADLRKLPARLIGELSEREPGRPAAQESV